LNIWYYTAFGFSNPNAQLFVDGGVKGTTVRNKSSFNKTVGLNFVGKDSSIDLDEIRIINH